MMNAKIDVTIKTSAAVNADQRGVGCGRAERTRAF